MDDSPETLPFLPYKKRRSKSIVDYRTIFGTLPPVRDDPKPALLPKPAVVVHPSPAFIAGPLLPAVALFLTGAYKGTMTAGQSLPALILLIGTYLLSRWYRRSALVLDDEGVSLGDRTLKYADISVVKRAVGGRRQQWERFSFFDKNNAKRLTFTPCAYGAGKSRIVRVLAAHLPTETLDPALTRSTDRPIRLLWVAIILLFALTLADGFIT